MNDFQIAQWLEKNGYDPENDRYPFFYIKKEFLVAVPEIYTTITKKGNAHLNIGIVDHPTFDRLRKILASENFIDIELNYWNGDRVISPFFFNDIKLNIGDIFYSGMAWKFMCKINEKDWLYTKISESE